MTQIVGIIGYPVQHSLSPLFQQAAFNYLGLDIVYEAWETPPESLAQRLAVLREPGYLGANVTIPHKERVFTLLDDIDSVAQVVGAVNTIVKQEDKLVGYNTDVAGLREALLQEGIRIEETATVVLGAGGAARAALHMLLNAGTPRVWVVNRSPARAEELIAGLARWFPTASTELRALSYDDSGFSTAVQSCGLVLNCTSVGMKGSPAEHQVPLPVEQLPDGAFVYDLVYIPVETPLVREARRRGLRAASGLSMLIYQGAEAFRLWTGYEPPIPVMEMAAREALKLAPKA